MTGKEEVGMIGIGVLVSKVVTRLPGLSSIGLNLTVGSCTPYTEIGVLYKINSGKELTLLNLNYS